METTIKTAGAMFIAVAVIISAMQVNTAFVEADLNDRIRAVQVPDYMKR